MIDITKIQTFPVAPALSSLQSANSKLIKNNEQLKTVVGIITIAGGAYITYLLIKRYNEHKKRTENQSSGN